MNPDAALAATGAAASAARNAALWSDVAELARAALDAETASLAFYGVGGEALVRACPSTDPAMHRRYSAELHALNYLWDAAARLPAGRAASEDMLGGRERYRKSEIYNEFIRPQRMDSVMLLTLAGIASGGIGILTIGRRLGREGFDAREIEFGEKLAGALANILRVTGLPVADRDADSSVSFDVLVTPEGRLLTHPPALIGLVKRGALGIVQGILSGPAMPNLAAAIRAAGRSAEVWPPPVALSIGPVILAGQAYRLDITPGGVSAPGAVRITFCRLVRVAPLVALRRRYGLTEREAEIAQHLAQGLGLPEAAEHLGIQLTTARTHLGRLFEKTGTRSQLALALRVAREMSL